MSAFSAQKPAFSQYNSSKWKVGYSTVFCRCSNAKNARWWSHWLSYSNWTL